MLLLACQSQELAQTGVIKDEALRNGLVVEAASDPSLVSPMSSKPLSIIPQITLKHNKILLDTVTYLFIMHLMVRHWQVCCILIQKADSNWPSPTRFLSRKCLWSFLSVGGAGAELLEDEGLGGRLATGRHLSLPAWHLPTAANLLLISSRPCAWQRRGFQISFSPPS